MKSLKELTIDKVAWHIRIEGNPESPEQVRRRFRILVDFLQEERLVVRQLLEPGSLPTDDFAIKISDLTEVGLAVIKSGYQQWLKKIVNKRMDVADVSIFRTCLHRIRSS